MDAKKGGMSIMNGVVAPTGCHASVSVRRARGREPGVISRNAAPFRGWDDEDVRLRDELGLRLDI